MHKPTFLFLKSNSQVQKLFCFDGSPPHLCKVYSLFLIFFSWWWMTECMLCGPHMPHLLPFLKESCRLTFPVLPLFFPPFVNTNGKEKSHTPYMIRVRTELLRHFWTHPPVKASPAYLVDFFPPEPLASRPRTLFPPLPQDQSRWGPCSPTTLPLWLRCLPPPLHFSSP